MKLIPLSTYRNLYKGETCCVVGGGPLNANLSSLPSNLVFLINDAIFLTEIQTNTKKFFHTHHPELERFKGRDAIYIGTWFPCLIGEIQIYSEVVIINEDEKLPEWTLDKDYIAKKSNLACKPGTITSLLHFLWFCGFGNILGIGINPATVNQPHDPKILQAKYIYDPLLNGEAPPEKIARIKELKPDYPQYTPDIVRIITNQQEFISTLNLKVTYL